MLVDDSRWLETAAPRLRLLQQDYGHAFALRQASESSPVGAGACLLGDDRHLLRLAATEYPAGELLLHQPLAQRAAAEAFEERWQNAGHDLPARPLGL